MHRRVVRHDLSILVIPVPARTGRTSKRAWVSRFLFRLAVEAASRARRASKELGHVSVDVLQLSRVQFFVDCVRRSGVYSGGNQIQQLYNVLVVVPSQVRRESWFVR